MTLKAKINARITANPHIIDGIPAIVDGSMVFTIVVGAMNRT